MEQGGYRSIARLFRGLTVILFLAGIGLPLLGAIAGWNPWYSFNEKRTLASFPAWPRDVSEAESYFPGAMSFYRDHFGFRQTLIHAAALANVGFLHRSTNSEVIIGEDGWLFLHLSDGPGSSDFSPLAPLSDAELNTWRTILEKRAAWLAQRHIAYLVVLVPEKQSIYPEFLPAARRASQHQDWATQLVDRLKSTGSPVKILNLQPVLLKAKNREPVFWKSDTHWNQFGVYIGYRAIMDEVHRLLPGRPLIVLGPADFDRFRARGVGGDLADLLGVPELFDEHFITMLPRNQQLPPRGAEQMLYEVDGDPRMPRLVMYHDSFGFYLIPLLARSFSHGAYFWGKQNMRADFIAREKPDIVIDEFAERFLTANRWETPGNY
jgi:alginate O-acetyltransferase complex protein AlgJ